MIKGNYFLRCIFIIGLFILFFSCKKSVPYDPGKVLSGGSWHYTNLEKTLVSGGIQGSWVSKFDTLDPCIKDDITVFNSDNTYQINESAIACSGNPNSIKESGQWSIRNDTLELDILNSGVIISSKRYIMTNLSNQTLQLINQGSLAGFPSTPGSQPDYEEFRWTYSH